MTRRRLPPPADWAIRTCPETAIADTLICWRFPPPSIDGHYETAREEVGEALARLRSLGLPWEDGNLGTRLYDPCEVVNFLIAAGMTGQDRFWGQALRLVTPARFHGAPAPAMRD